MWGRERSCNNTVSFLVVRMIKATRQIFSHAGIEPFIWIAALLYLAVSPPPEHPDFTLCPLAHMGITHCPGCGLGRSVSYAFHGEFSESYHAHVAGMPAILILTARIFSIFRNARRTSPNNSHTTKHQRSAHGKRNAVNADTGKR